MRRGRPPYPDLLTPREQQVLALLREGLTNQEIADRLGITLYGARYHVSEILSKLGVSRREEAAAWQGRRSYLGVPLIGGLLDRLRGVAPWKLAAALPLSIAAVALVALAAGVLVSSKAPDATETAALASPTPAPATAAASPQPDIPLPRVIGPYYIAPATDGRPPDEGFVPANANLPSGPPADDLPQARQSTLFPAELPEGYTVVGGHSMGQPAESYLQLTLEGPAGQVFVALFRPDTLPVWVAFDGSGTADLVIRGRDTFAIVPTAGSTDETTVRGFYRGVDVQVSARGVDVDELSSLLHDLLPDRFERPGPYSLAPELPPESERLPRAQDIDATGPCRVTPSVTVDYVYQGARISLLAGLDCTGLVPFSACPSTYAGPIDGLDVACDDAGYRIDAHWETDVEGNSCSGGHPLVIKDGAMLGAMSCGPLSVVSGGSVQIDTCVSVRDQETCVRFEYRTP